LVGLVAAAFMNSFGAGGVRWAGAGCAAAAAIAFRRPIAGFLAASVGAFAIVVAGSIPAIVVLGDNAVQTTKGSPADQEDIGKLFAPLEALQGAGLWPAGDFRLTPDPRWIAVLLALGGLLAAGGAVALALRRRSWPLP